MKNKDQEIRDFIIKVGSIGGSFLGEHIFHEPTLEKLVEEFKEIKSKGGEE